MGVAKGSTPDWRKRSNSSGASWARGARFGGWRLGVFGLERVLVRPGDSRERAGRPRQAASVRLLVGRCLGRAAVGRPPPVVRLDEGRRPFLPLEGELRLGQ